MSDQKQTGIAATPQAIIEAAANTRLLVFDVDGTLTDGRMYYSCDGDDLVAFNARDGYALRTVQRAGLELAVVSGRNSQAVRQRMQNLGVVHVHLGIQNKLDVLQQMLDTMGLSANQMCYAGDDWIDLPAIEMAGLGVAVADAVPAVRAAADWCTQAKGGEGAARELIELILSAQNLMHTFHPQSHAGHTEHPQ